MSITEFRHVLKYLCISAAVAMSCSHCIIAQAQAAYEGLPVTTCVLPRLPVVFPSSLSTIDLGNVAFSSTRNGQTTAIVDVKNVGSRTITGLAFVVEFLDQRGSTITQVSFGARNAASQWHLPFAVENIEDLSSRLEPGKHTLLTGIADGIFTFTCPVRARVSFLVEEATGESPQIFSESHWNLGPIPRYVPPLSQQYSQTYADTQVDVCALVRIDATGKVTGVSPENNGQHLPAWMSGWMKRDWSFHPAIADGHPTTAEIRVFFRLGLDPNAVLSSGLCTEQPVTLIRLANELNSQVAKMSVWYGEMPEYGVVE